MRHLADHPLYAQTIAAEAFAAGPAAIERNLALAHALATLLLAGAPTNKANSRLTVEGVAGAIWHTIRCQVTSGQTRLLPAMSDYLAYVVLAPFIGAEAAAEVVTRPERQRDGAPTRMRGGAGAGDGTHLGAGDGTRAAGGGAHAAAGSGRRAGASGGARVSGSDGARVGAGSAARERPASRGS